MVTNLASTALFTDLCGTVDYAIDTGNYSSLVEPLGIKPDAVDAYDRAREERQRGVFHAQPHQVRRSVDGSEIPDGGSVKPVLQMSRRRPPGGGWSSVAWGFVQSDGKVRTDSAADSPTELPKEEEPIVGSSQGLYPLIPSTLGPDDVTFLPVLSRQKFLNLMQHVDDAMEALTAERFEATPEVIIDLQNRALIILESYLYFDSVFQTQDLESVITARQVAILQNYIKDTVMPLLERLTWYLAVFPYEPKIACSLLAASVGKLNDKIVEIELAGPMTPHFYTNSALSVIRLTRLKPTLHFLAPEPVQNPVWRDFLMWRKNNDELVVAAKIADVPWPGEPGILPFHDSDIADVWGKIVLVGRSLQAYWQTVQAHPATPIHLLQFRFEKVFVDFTLGVAQAILWAAYFQDDEKDEPWRDIFVESFYDFREFLFLLRSQNPVVFNVDLTHWCDLIERELNWVEQNVIVSLESVSDDKSDFS